MFRNPNQCGRYGLSTGGSSSFREFASGVLDWRWAEWARWNFDGVTGRHSTSSSDEDFSCEDNEVKKISKPANKLLSNELIKSCSEFYNWHLTPKFQNKKSLETSLIRIRELNSDCVRTGYRARLLDLIGLLTFTKGGSIGSSSSVSSISSSTTLPPLTVSGSLPGSPSGKILCVKHNLKSPKFHIRDTCWWIGVLLSLQMTGWVGLFFDCSQLLQRFTLFCKKNDPC